MTVEIEKKTNKRALDKNGLTNNVNKNNSYRNIEAQNVNIKNIVKNEKNGFINKDEEKDCKNKNTIPVNGVKLGRKDKPALRNGDSPQELQVNNDDDFFNILEGLEEEDKRRQVEEYVNSLPDFTEPEFESNENVPNKESLEEIRNRSSVSSSRKSSAMNPYVSSNITFCTQKKNYTFNSYQLWKIKRDNEKIAERLQKLETRKPSAEYVNDIKRISSNSAVIRQNATLRIEAENKAIEQEIQRIKDSPNRKAPWYKPKRPWLTKSPDKNKKT